MPHIVLKSNPSKYRLSAPQSSYDAALYLEMPPGLGVLVNLSTGEEIVPSRYWKLNAEQTDVLEMSRTQKDAVDAARDATRLQNAKTEGKAIFDDSRDGTSLVLRAVIRLLIDEINTLRALHSLPARTLTGLRAALRKKIDGET